MGPRSAMRCGPQARATSGSRTTAKGTASGIARTNATGCSAWRNSSQRTSARRRTRPTESAGGRSRRDYPCPMRSSRPTLRDLSLSTHTAGFVAVLVGFTSSVAIVFQAATALGASPAQVSSWMWALGVGMGLGTAIPSLLIRKPVMIAWSTPGAAVLATAAVSGGFAMDEAVGAFLISAALVTLVGVTGWFERVMDRIPLPLANALLAGVLARFGLDAFIALRTSFALVAAML